MRRSQSEELSALQVWNWDVYEGSLKYRLDFLNGFFVQPYGRVRYGTGNDESQSDFEANLWEGSLRVGYNRQKKINASANFSVIQVGSDGGLVPIRLWRVIMMVQPIVSNFQHL